MIMGENIDVNIIKRGLQVIVPKNVEKDSSNVIAACPGLHQWLETNKRSHPGRYYPYKQNDIG